MIVALSSKSGALSSTDLGNIAATRVVDELRRVPGLGDVVEFGSGYAMRIWLDPEHLASYGLSPNDVVAAIREQNAQTAGGSLGALPAVKGQLIDATIATEDRLKTEDEFRQVILRADTEGATVRLGDVARVELGAQSYATSASFNEKPMAGITIQLATGANALDTAEGVRQRMEGSLPEDVAWDAPSTRPRSWRFPSRRSSRR